MRRETRAEVEVGRWSCMWRPRVGEGSKGVDVPFCSMDSTICTTRQLVSFVK